MRRHEKDYLLRHDKKYFEKARQSAEQLRQGVNNLHVSADDKAALISLLDVYLHTMEVVISEEDQLTQVNNQLNEAFDKLDAALLAKEKVAETLMEDTERDALNQVHATQNRAAATSGIAVLVAIFSAAFFVHTIRKLLVGVASNLSASASQIAAAINEQDRISNLQASSVNETNTTMEELGSSSRQSSEQAESAASNAQRALEAAEHGMSRVEDMVMGMNITKTKVDAIAQQILRLSEQTSQISTITGTVTDFANETKMLAMNAAVEAVRAGEHGKGFSVLAVEIRKLAEESKRSAERINSLVLEIQKATNATVMATEEGGKTVDQGMLVAQNTAEAFAEVSEAVNSASQSSQQISLNVRQQAVAIRQVVEAMKSINTGAKETAAGISQIKAGTQVLNESAGQLKAMI
ncbi:MAG: chemotaxis protein [Magnetococcales bacterium]|nr:chemotaxis protein [Magnetococcales bacterium]NGZ27276.1 chemotaxis protein [Magnetococcales bacterium]